MAAPTSLAIAQLHPGLDPDSTSASGVVTLIWPYASSTQTLSLLLVEPDFRLRRHRGQVRVHFHGSSARALSKAGLSSGDRLSLSLTGVQFSKETFAASTPGKGIDWELRYGERVVLQVQRANQDATSLDIDHPSPVPEPPTPTSTRRISASFNSHIPTTTREFQPSSQAWQSPAFLKRSHLSSSSYDPFAEEEFADNARSKRTKFGRGSGQWRFAERTPSPDKELDTSILDNTSPSKVQKQEGSSVEDLTSAVQTFKYEPTALSNLASEAARQETSKIGVISPPSPPVTHVESAESEVTGELPPTEQSRPAASPQLIYSTSVTSEFGQESEFEDGSKSLSDNGDAGKISAGAVGSGLDGSAYSGAQQLLKAIPDKKRDVQDVDDLNDVAKEFEKDHDPETSIPTENETDGEVVEGIEPPSMVEESAHELMVIDESDSEQESQNMPSSPSSSFDQLQNAEVSDKSVSIEGEGSSEEEAPRLFLDETVKLEGKELAIIEQQQATVPESDSTQTQEIPAHRTENPIDLPELKQSNVEIIDLESEDEEELDGRTSPGSDTRVSLSPKFGMVDSSTPEKGFTAISPTGASPTDGHNVAEERMASPPAPSDERETALRPSTADQQPPIEEPTFASQSPKVDVKPLLLSTEDLPATIQETLNDPSSNLHLMTPTDTQGSTFVSQPSFTSLQILPNEETLPTPRLTQTTSAGIVPPELLSLAASQEPPDLEEAPSLEESLAVEVDSSTPRNETSLIQKLRAMRNLSSGMSDLTSVKTTASPWFAVRRSSHFVPDSEVQSEVESSSEKEQSTQLTAASTGQPPENPKPLPASFVRSTSQRTNAASIASSPVYLPPSQPPPPGFRTHLSYFVPLATLPQHFTTVVDILAIAIGSTQVSRAISGARDYNQTIYVTDPSSSKLQPPVTKAQIFRSYNKCFPILDPGDAIMLREFRVQSFQRQMTLLSTQSSSWAVFRKGVGVQIRGPPVELGAEERLFARGLWRWWDGLSDEERTTLKEMVPKEEPRRADQIAATNGNRASGGAVKTDGGGNPDSKIKRESINGLGVDLSSQQTKTRRASRRERSVEFNDTADSDKIIESTEPPKRILRPRGARGLPERSESPLKALDTRHGTVFTGGLGEPESE